MKRKFVSSRCLVVLALCILTCNMNAQKVSQDSLDFYQLKLQMEKAVKMRQTGVQLVFVPLALGLIIGGHALITYDPDDAYNPLRFFLLEIVGFGFVPVIVTGGALWAAGNKRIDRIEIALQKFHVMPENSIELGVGIKFNFRF